MQRVQRQVADLQGAVDGNVIKKSSGLILYSSIPASDKQRQIRTGWADRADISDTRSFLVYAFLKTTEGPEGFLSGHIRLAFSRGLCRTRRFAVGPVSYALARLGSAAARRWGQCMKGVRHTQSWSPFFRPEQRPASLHPTNTTANPTRRGAASQPCPIGRHTRPAL